MSEILETLSTSADSKGRTEMAWCSPAVSERRSQSVLGCAEMSGPIADIKWGKQAESIEQCEGGRECRTKGAFNPWDTQGVGLIQSGGDDKVAAFVVTAEHSREQLLWLAQRMTRDRSEAEDIVQEALLKAFRYLPRFRGESQMRTWLGVIVKNTGLEWLRERKGRVYLSLEYACDPNIRICSELAGAVQPGETTPHNHDVLRTARNLID